MRLNARSQVIVTGFFSGNFLVHVGLHKDSVLTLLYYRRDGSIIKGNVQKSFFILINDFALVSKSLEGLKCRVESWKEALQSKGRTVTVKKMITSEKARNDKKEGNFTCADRRLV